MISLDLNKMKWNWPHFEDLKEEPTGRQRHSAAIYGNNKMILFGGFDGVKWLNDLYCLDLNALNGINLKKENFRQLSENLYQNLFDKPEFSDYTLVVAEKPIFTHRGKEKFKHKIL